MDIPFNVIGIYIDTFYDTYALSISNITICNIILILVYVWLIIERMIISMRSIECKNQVMIIVVVVILVYEYTVFYTFHNHHSE